MRQWSFSSISARPRRWVIVGVAAVAIASVLALLAAGKYIQDAHASAGPAAPAAVAVSVGLLKPQSVKPFAEFSGRINAVDYAEIRPQVTGRITEIRFTDGQRVNAGDVLFVIDPRPYQAAVDKAQADLASAMHNAKFAKAERDRGTALVKSNTLSQETYDQRVNADDSGQAAVQSAAAVLAAAQVNLDYAYVKAPISGRISRAEITLGNLVGSTTTAPQLLTSVVSDNGVYADFEVDEQTYLNAVRDYGQTQEQEQKIPVDVVARGDDSNITHGHIESFDNRIDTGSGTIRARARFA